MKKTPNVKATKLMVDDHIDVSGNMYRILSLSRTFGSSEKERVRMMARGIDDKRLFMNLTVRKGTLFTIYNQ